jgi:flagellar hook-basal body complex protein FliE
MMAHSLSLQLPQMISAPSAAPGNSLSSQASQSKGLFGQMLMDAMGQVVNQQAQAEHLVEDHLLGHPVTDVEVLTAIKQAELTLKTALQVRNKVVEAYNELKQIQV